MRRAAALLTCLIVACPLAAAPIAVAQLEPSLPVPSQNPEPAPAPVQSTDDDEGLSSLEQGLLGLAGLALILGIGYAIVRDARRRAPVAPGAPVAAEGTGKPKPYAQKQRAKKRSKVARQARRRNRPR